MTDNWCPRCLLPSVVEADLSFYGLTANGVDTLPPGRVRVCTECSQVDIFSVASDDANSGANPDAPSVRLGAVDSQSAG